MRFDMQTHEREKNASLVPVDTGILPPPSHPPCVRVPRSVVIITTVHSPGVRGNAQERHDVFVQTHHQHLHLLLQNRRTKILSKGKAKPGHGTARATIFAFVAQLSTIALRGRRVK